MELVEAERLGLLDFNGLVRDLGSGRAGAIQGAGFELRREAGVWMLVPAPGQAVTVGGRPCPSGGLSLATPCFVRSGGGGVALCPLQDGTLRLGELRFASRAMARAVFQVLAASASTHPVLLEGPSGAGKELLATAVHACGLQAPGPLVAVNCGALSRELALSELFGCERGAYTGAVRDRRGLVAEAHKGVLFLDEVSELPLETQAALLRVLEGAPVRALGSERPRAWTFRLVAAANCSLGERVARGLFRADLLQRISVLRVRVPGLAERPEDLPVLWRHFAGQELPASPGPEALRLLVRYPWPGNVRELRGFMERLKVFGAGVPAPRVLLDLLLEQGSLAPGSSRSELLRVAGLPRSTYYYRLKRSRESA
jgi:transcriptional regulator of acetoin/glycerol metabolism